MKTPQETENKQDKFEFIIIPKNVLQDNRLNGSSKILYGYLKFRTNENDYCWPGYITIQRDLNLNSKTIKHSIDQLKKLGWIKYTQGKRGWRGANRYYLNSSPQLNQVDKVGNPLESKGTIRKPYQAANNPLDPGGNPLESKANNPLESKGTILSSLKCKRIEKRKGLKEEEKEKEISSSSTPQGGTPPLNPPIEEANKEFSLQDISTGKFQGKGKRKSRDDSKGPIASWPLDAPHQCGECGSPTVQRTSERGQFTGCSDYPNCKWIYRPSKAPSHIQAIKDEDWYEDWKKQIPDD